MNSIKEIRSRRSLRRNRTRCHNLCLQQAVEAEGLFYPPTRRHIAIRSLGDIAENAVEFGPQGMA